MAEEYKKVYDALSTARDALANVLNTMPNIDPEYGSLSTRYYVICDVLDGLEYLLGEGR